MPRLHLLELEDQAWFPDVLRNAMTDFLSFLGNVSDKPYAEFAKRVGTRMSALGTHRVVDLCSGGGGPGLSLARRSAAHPRSPREGHLSRRRAEGAGRVTDASR